jgi:hypothetical protein
VDCCLRKSNQRHGRTYIERATPNDHIWSSDAKGVISWLESKRYDVGSCAWICDISKQNHDYLLKLLDEKITTLKALRKPRTPKKLHKKLYRDPNGMSRSSEAIKARRERNNRILKRLAEGETSTSIGKDLNLSSSLIRNIKLQTCNN